jgi:hypothetical protein
METDMQVDSELCGKPSAKRRTLDNERVGVRVDLVLSAAGLRVAKAEFEQRPRRFLKVSAGDEEVDVPVRPELPPSVEPAAGHRTLQKERADAVGPQ